MWHPRTSSILRHHVQTLGSDIGTIPAKKAGVTLHYSTYIYMIHCTISDRAGEYMYAAAQPMEHD